MDHPNSDHFLAHSLNPKWTVWNSSGDTVIDVDGRLSIVQPNQASSSHISGILQPIHESEAFNLSLDVRMAGRCYGYRNAGLVLGADLIANPSTAEFRAWWEMTTGLDLHYAYEHWTNQGLFASKDRHSGPWGLLPWVRLHVDLAAGTLLPLLSADGKSWNAIQNDDGNDYAIGFVPDSYGIAVNNYQSGFDQTLLSRGFHVEDTADPFVPVPAGWV